MDEETDRRIKAAAKELLDVLATPIAGVPSVKVINERNALRLIGAAFETLWKVVNEVDDVD